MAKYNCIKIAIGTKLNRWTVIGAELSNGAGRGKSVLCRCDCGTEKYIDKWTLTRGKSMSCGCLLSEWCSKNKTKHGMTGTKTYHCWRGMWDRCTNKNNPAYRHYGGRGITVSRNWLTFERFYQDMGVCPPDKSLGRINNDRGYSKTNCRWESQKQQNRNYRRNHIIKYRGKNMCIADWADKVGIRGSIIRERLNRGWSVSDALTLPPRHITAPR